MAAMAGLLSVLAIVGAPAYSSAAEATTAQAPSAPSTPSEPAAQAQPGAPPQTAPQSQAGDTTSPAGTPAAPLRLDPGATLEIACQTQAVLVATDAANATSGTIHLRLERTADAGQDGRWKPLGDTGSHAASLVTLQAKTCASGCPLMIGNTGDLQLWAPAPKSIDKLAPDELLLLAVLKSETWQLKASTFRGPSIEALESGSCKSDSAATSKP